MPLPSARLEPPPGAREPSEPALLLQPASSAEHEGLAAIPADRGGMLVPLALGFVLGLITMLAVLAAVSRYRAGTWTPAFLTSDGFPPSGTVAVSNKLKMKTVTSRLSVQADANNVVVQMLPAGKSPVLTLYVDARDRVIVPAPAGTFRLSMMGGQAWDKKARTFAGKAHRSTIPRLLTFSAHKGNGVDLSVQRQVKTVRASEDDTNWSAP